MSAALATTAAVDHRGRTGVGKHIDLSQMEALVASTGTALQDFDVNGRVQLRVGNRLLSGDTPYAAPHGSYPTKGKDRWIAIAVAALIHGDDAESTRQPLGDGPPEGG